MRHSYEMIETSVICECGLVSNNHKFTLGMVEGKFYVLFFQEKTLLLSSTEDDHKSITSITNGIKNQHCQHFCPCQEIVLAKVLGHFMASLLQFIGGISTYILYNG